MRDILNLLDTLTEATGLAGRTPGEQYAPKGSTDPKSVMTFKDLVFYPKSGRYESKEQALEAFKQVEQQVGPVETLPGNRPSTAFGIAQFDTATGPRYIVKFTSEIKPVRNKNDFFQTKDIPGGYSLMSKSGSKENIGYKPNEVLKNLKSQTPASIVAQIGAKFGQDSAEYQAASIFLSATSFPVEVPAGNMDYAGFRDYFCEMLQPIALINGMPVTGNAAKAAEIFLDGDFSDCIVSFNAKPSGELFDSLLIAPSGKQVKLSSKGAKGAMASSVNLIKAVRELEAAGMTQFRKQYAEPIRILEVIEKEGHNEAPLQLAIDYGIIDQAEAKQVYSLEKYSGQKDFNIDKVPGISDNLKQLYKARKANEKKEIVPINHMVASIAYTVVNKINMETNFSEAAADILNNSAFVQMYTIMPGKSKNGMFVIERFDSVWPSKLFTDVTLEAVKSYASTARSAGKLVFNINKEPKVEPNVDSESTEAPAVAQAQTQDLDTAGEKRSSVTARAGGAEKKLGSKATLGRKRQQY